MNAWTWALIIYLLVGVILAFLAVGVASGMRKNRLAQDEYSKGYKAAYYAVCILVLTLVWLPLTLFIIGRRVGKEEAEKKQVLDG